MNRKPCNKNGSHKAAVVINGAGDGTHDFLRKLHPSTQAPSGVLQKTCHRHVFLTQNHLSVLVPIKVRFQNCRQRCGCRKVINGAGDGTRTRECELGKLVPYHLATPAYIRFALHAKPCGHYSLKHASASEQNENVRESSTHRAQEASSARSAETRGRSKSLVRRRVGSAAWYQALMQVLPQGKGGRWPSRSLFCSAGVGRCPPSLQTLFS